MPGRAYLVRVPGEDEGSLADSVEPTPTAASEPTGPSAPSQLLGSAKEITAAAAAPPVELDALRSRTRRPRAPTAKSSVENAGSEEVAVRRRARRRQARLASLDEVIIDADDLPRRRRRKLNRAERRARKRPTRRRVRRAKRQRKKSLRAAARAQRRNQPSRRHVRKVSAAEQELAHRQDKLNNKSTRRRRRKARKAEQELARLKA